jgi:hypothetical protein
MSPAAQLTFAAASYALLWGVSWWGAIARGWGAAESAHDPASGWMYVRRLLLVAAGVTGVAWAGGASLATLGWGLSPWLPAVILAGLAMGASNRGGFRPTGATPVLLALFHTFAVELYFRGYLFRHLSGLIDLWALPLSAAAYAVYYLTVDTVWAGGRRGRLAGLALFGFLGVVFAGCYIFTGSFLGAWLAHFGAVLRWRERRRGAGEAARGHG